MKEIFLKKCANSTLRQGMNLETTRNLNHQIGVNLNYLWILETHWKRKKKSIWALPKLCTGRSLAPQRTGPAQQLGRTRAGATLEAY